MRWAMVELQPARAAGISGGLSGPAGVDWPEPLAKWVLEPAACVLPCTRVPPTTPDGARPPPHFRGNTSGPRLPLPPLRASHLARFWRFSPLRIRHRHSFSVETLRQSPIPASRGWCVCTRCVASDHSFFRRPLCVPLFSRSLPDIRDR